MEGLFALIQKGGFVMYPLIILSLISWAVIVERLVNLRGSLYIPKHTDQVKSLLAGGDLEGALKVLQLEGSVGGRILAHILHSHMEKRSKDEVVREVDLELSLVVSRLEKNLPILSTIASVSPLLGLFGTITGLIKVFSAFAITQLEQGMTLLASGISEALIAAATGLAVAIPALLAYWVFKVMAGNIMDRLEDHIAEVVRLLR